MTFATALALCGPLRAPRQLLAHQEYGGHRSIHDGAEAARLGFSGAPIEGPTHFSQLTPLCVELWGRAFFERGCISARYRTPVVEGEQVRAFAALPRAGATRTELWAEKADGTLVLSASASLGPDHGVTLLEERLAQLPPPSDLRILADLRVGMRGAEDERVRVTFDGPLGSLYPFTLREKLACITEPSAFYEERGDSPWGRPILPLEMVSVLAEHTAERARFPVRGPVVGLFADQEIRLHDGPLFAGEDYLLRREIVGLGSSARAETYWVKTRIFDARGERLKAEMLLNHACLKASYGGA
jgi:hypothetical protein